MTKTKKFTDDELQVMQYALEEKRSKLIKEYFFRQSLDDDSEIPFEVEIDALARLTSKVVSMYSDEYISGK